MYIHTHAHTHTHNTHIIWLKQHHLDLVCSKRDAPALFLVLLLFLVLFRLFFLFRLLGLFALLLLFGLFFAFALTKKKNLRTQCPGTLTMYR